MGGSSSPHNLRPAGRGVGHSLATFAGELREDIRNAPPWQLGLLVFSIALAGLFITMLGLALTEDAGSSNRSQANASDAPKHDPSRDVRGAGTDGTPNAPGFGEETNRKDCEDIVATGAYNDTERQWAIDNCPDISSEFVEAEPRGEPTPAGGNPTPAAPDPGIVVGLPPPGPTAPPAAPTAAPPQPTAPPANAFGAGDAISLAIGYYASAPGGHYDIDAAACTASSSAGLWNVSCVGRLAGCARAECVEVVNACVVAATRAVVTGSC